jgi:hypothetical protein
MVAAQTQPEVACSINPPTTKMAARMKAVTAAVSSVPR